jgi:NADPH:quinone reductase-like Zn-dependent oxidoreductase
VHAATVVSGELQWKEHPDPVPGVGDLLVEVKAAGVNAADLLQRLGLYPPPPGLPADIPGLELAGVVVAVGRGTSRFAIGDRVMSLVGGAAQAELAVVPERHAMAVPDGVAWVEAGGFPEAFATAHDALVTQCQLSLGERVLVTGAAGGVGIAAVQLAAVAGADVVASVRRPELRDAVMAYGARHADDPAAAVARGPFDVVLELVSGPGLSDSIAALGTGGRLSIIGVGAGARTELDALALMARRASVRGSTLRSRSHAEKELVSQTLERRVVPLLATGRVRVPVAETVPLEEAGAAYARFEAGGKLGKIVLRRS